MKYGQWGCSLRTASKSIPLIFKLNSVPLPLASFASVFRIFDEHTDDRQSILQGGDIRLVHALHSVVSNSVRKVS